MNWHKYFTYDHSTGRLIHIPRSRECFKTEGMWKSWNTRFANKPAGAESFQAVSGAPARILIKGFGKCYYAHHIIWNMIKGTIPNGMFIDHIDGNPFNNRIDNLRLATHGQNMHNARRPRNNTSGVKGVSWSAASQKWQVMIMVDKKHIYLGSYADKEVAAKVRQDAALKYHGQFAKHD